MTAFAPWNQTRRVSAVVFNREKWACERLDLVVSCGDWLASRHLPSGLFYAEVVTEIYEKSARTVVWDQLGNLLSYSFVDLEYLAAQIYTWRTYGKPSPHYKYPEISGSLIDTNVVFSNRSVKTVEQIRSPL